MYASDKGSSHATSPVITGASRFNVVFSRSCGSRKQRAKREGALSVAHDVSYLYDKDNNECVLRCKAAGPAPNKIFTCMQRAHCGADWIAGTELNFSGFDMLVEEVMELHLIPYGEDAAAVARDSAEVNSEAGAGCGVIPFSRASAPTASTASSVRTLSTPAPPGPGRGYTAHAQPSFLLLPRQTPLHIATAMVSRALYDNDRPSPTPFENENIMPICAPQEWPKLKTNSVSSGSLLTARDPTDSSPPALRDERGIAGSGDSDGCPPHQRQRRRSATSLARELERSYPHYF
ncbi:hypothetical protein JIQ42_07287 [Leishmania sp. Namibia]|uniref:hypothetical protein n=1 Tax=Leishmania sp. Namibia TaxID=2802991 RepID=UPI001B7093D8|nr:hypothetical protein JIQ42_07287 [Leishmania sp. Namibia]